MMISLDDAWKLLKALGAPDRLIMHARLVSEAAELLIAGLGKLDLELNSELVRFGAILHDAGKTSFPVEMDGPGNRHEPAGEQLLLQAGVQAEIARCCLSHARYHQMECSLEELLVALADKLWKGKREQDLELRVVDSIANRVQVQRWDIFTDMDSLFEKIAAGGEGRLARSSCKQ